MEVIESDRMIYLDIETGGLDPFESPMRAYGFVDSVTGEIELKGANRPSRERDLLCNLILLLRGCKEFGGWNITEFDLSFIAVRANKHDLAFPISPIRDEPYLGKYGNIRVSIPNRKVDDIAYDGGKKLAEELNVPWSLQPVAKELGFVPKSELTGADVVDAPISEVLAHCLDDLQAMQVVLRELRR